MSNPSGEVAPTNRPRQQQFVNKDSTQSLQEDHW